MVITFELNQLLQRNLHNMWANVASAWILLCKQCKFGKKIFLQFQRYRFFPRGDFFGAPCTLSNSCWNSLPCL